MTFKEKLKNYWYYYRVHTLVGLAFALLFIIMTAQCASNEKYDYSVNLYMSKPMTETITDTIASELERFGEDLNGDGKVRVQIFDCSYGENDNIRMNQTAKLQARLVLSESMLFITDETCYKKLDDMELFDSFDFLDAKDKKAKSLGVSPMEHSITREVGKYMPEDFYISLRKVEGTAIESDPDAYKNRDDSFELLKKLCDEYSAD